MRGDQLGGGLRGGEGHARVGGLGGAGAGAGGVEIVVVVGGVGGGAGGGAGGRAAGSGGVAAVATGCGGVSCSGILSVVEVVIVRGGRVGRHGVFVCATDFAPLLPLVLDDLFKQREPQDRFRGLRVFFLDAVGEPGFGVRGRETDEGFERTRRHGGRLALVALEFIISQGRVGRHDVVGCALGQDGLSLQFRVLDVFLDKRDTQDINLAGAAAARGDGDAGVEHDVKFLVDLGRLVGVLVVVEADADAEGLVLLLADGGAFFGAGLAVAVHAEDVL